MTAEKIATDFFDEVVDRLADRLMPDILQRIASQIPVAQDRKMTIEETANSYPISEKLLYRMCKEKQIPHIRMGVIGSRKPKILLSSATLDAWMKEQEQQNYKPAQ
jgi:hypothetical protein